ncbi:MAG: hypothetical protein V1694_02905 [Candidatus Eisenbacteria bacterium]
MKQIATIGPGIGGLTAGNLLARKGAQGNDLRGSHLSRRLHGRLL